MNGETAHGLPKKARKPFKSEFIRVPSFWRAASRGAPGATYELALAVLDEIRLTTRVVTLSCRPR